MDLLHQLHGGNLLKIVSHGNFYQTLVSEDLLCYNLDVKGLNSGSSNLHREAKILLEEN